MVIVKPGTGLLFVSPRCYFWHKSEVRVCEGNLIDIWSNPEYCYRDTSPHDMFIINCKEGAEMLIKRVCM